jgi:septal ring factor EnvC (AmiA/AmiB activator)
MLNEALVFAGIVLMSYSTFLAKRLIRILKTDALQKSWSTVFVLIIFFLLGYVIYFTATLTKEINLIINQILLATILCFGALFVVLVLQLSISLTTALGVEKESLKKENKSLKDLSKKLSRNKKQLENAKKELQEKNEELEKTLEDFYTLRLKMGSSVNSKKIDVENKNIKKRLDALKRPR